MEQSTEQMRLYIGSISQELHDDQEMLISRLERFGKVAGALEMHQKPTALNYFAYVNMEMDQKNLHKLKQHLNGVNFKNSRLRIDVLKPDYIERCAQDRERPNLKLDDILKREKIALVRQNRILHGIDELVIKGRLRKTKRKNLKMMTVRCFLNGKLITLKSRKSKLWGYDKTKKLRDLTWIFDKDSWKDGNLHIKEKVSLKNSPVDLVKANAEEAGEVDDVSDDEKLKNQHILSELFQTFDFDKPVDLEVEAGNDDESGHSDYEFELSIDVGARDSYDIKTKDCASDNIIEEFKRANPLQDQPKPWELGNDADELVDERESVEGTSNDKAEDETRDKEEEIVEEPAKESDSDVDDEFLPTFGKTIEPVVNDTENLRTLFNPTESTTFKLNDDSDIDEELDNEVEIDQEEILREQQLKKEMMEVPVNKSLFFPHQESPFLLSQSQLNKIAKEFDKEEYEKWFYEKRGELNREFKRHKRDILRQMNKRR